MEWMLLAMIPLLGLMMWSSVKKQKAQAAAQQKMQDEMAPGTRIMTTSGLFATVVAVGDKTIDLEIADGVVTSWLKAAVREIVEQEPALEDDLAAEIPDYVPEDLDKRVGETDTNARPDTSGNDRPKS